MKILVINAGSSSLKYQLFDMNTESVIAKGNCERIGIDGLIKHTPVSNGKPVFQSDTIKFPTHTEAINVVIEKLTSEEYGVINSLTEIVAVGHRFVHGGPDFSESVLITDEVLEKLKSYLPLAPLHTPANLMGLYACQAAMPGVPQVAVFDTAFHHTIPEHAYVYPIPYKYYKVNNIRRYGFHGTSHRFVSAIAINLLGGTAEGTKIITCHLGNGASLAAIKDGKCIDTTMGVTPLEGLPMGTRCGSIDPTIVSIISDLENGMGFDDVMSVLNKKSGMLGLTGVSSDFRDIETAAGYNLETGERLPGVEINERADLALNVFAYQVAKFIGSYIAALGGLDALVFTAGVGENSLIARKNICNHLKGMGINIDIAKNTLRGTSEPVDISAEDSNAKVYIIPTNEELVIARDTLAVCNN
jgi:acetate kinase